MIELKTDNPREAELHAEIDQARAKLVELEKTLHVVSTDLEREESDQDKFAALGDVCESLGRLEKLGGSWLFWGEDSNQDNDQFVSTVYERVVGYERNLQALRRQREQLQVDIRTQNNNIGLRQEAILDLVEQEERKKHEFVIERDIAPLPFRPMVMPWSKDNPDEKQLRKFVSIALLYSVLMWLVIPMINVPLPDIAEEVEIPERLAKLIKKEEPKPEPEKQTEQQQNQQVSKERAEARKKVQKTGLLAFKDNFTELMNVATEANLGASADVSSGGQQSTQAARNLVVAKSSAVSGISSASLSRNTGGASEGLKGGVQFTRVESSIGIGDGGPDRPTGSSAPPRTDEEIQIVFDRYKASLYRIYQRELRKDPTLRGNMVLRIVIGPDGNVVSCTLESADIKSQALIAQIIDRVKRFQFGDRKGAPKMTILYPIDFLPAT
ncbi:MAG: AgmX/PglI C-terminal domain-containing protein [Gammaproteobacteria bacterium]|nr:AgmX/PglI C-terminal domain-containing protein [Gammaproteobacteria bacterium]